MQKSGFVKVQGCAFLAQSSAHVTSAMEESWIRIEHILEICPLVGIDRIRESITKDEYDDRPNDEFYGITGSSVNPKYWKYFTSCRLYLSGQTSRATVIEIRESAESLISRINAIEYPPETPEPTVLGYAQELTNVQAITLTVPEDIDEFETITFRGKAARTANAALVMADNVMSTVAPEDIGVGSNPLTATGALVIALPAGNIRVSRNDAGTVLYLVADDAVQAFGIQIIGR